MPGKISKVEKNNVDKTEFNGRLYRRYPDSPHSHLQRYYSRAGGHNFLHRDVWEHFYGAIPPGHHIHHKNGNHLDNSIENLECLSCEEHHAKHFEGRRERGRSPKQLAHLKSIQKKAIAWHKSEEGRAWHSLHAEQAYANRTTHTLACQECGESFKSKFSNAQFCSRRCQFRNWAKRHPGYSAAKKARKKAACVQHNDS
jgi:endogenous inhibitor of DNA gyrase (YacG/DUF329 family)